MPSKLNTAIASLIGIDLGKNTFHLVGLDRRGAIVSQLKLSRGQLERRLANVPRCLIGMEACVGASPQPQAAEAWARCPADACEVRAPLLEGPEERLPRRGGDRRGGAASDHEVCRDQDRRPA
jgi:hypothetical protein